MKDYMKPSLRNAPNYFIFHVGTNDLNSDKTSKSIANTIIDLATSVKNEQYDVSLSNIILGMDNTNLNEKRCLVNSILAEMCKEKTYLTILGKSSRVRSKEVNFIYTKRDLLF